MVADALELHEMDPDAEKQNFTPTALLFVPYSLLKSEAMDESESVLYVNIVGGPHNMSR